MRYILRGDSSKLKRMTKLGSVQKALKSLVTVSLLAYLLGLTVGFAVVYSPLAGTRVTPPAAEFVSAAAGILFGAILNTTLQAIWRLGSKIVRPSAPHNVRRVEASRTVPA
jgi:hypothetical protein